MKVTALHNHWLFDNPRTMYIHFESIDRPLAFARNVKDALNVLKPPGNNLTTSSRVTPLCKRFASILGGTPATINGVCTVTHSRLNLHPTILGRKTRSFLAIPQAFSFESMDSSGRALCLGETVILQSELQRFISVLRKHGIKVTAFHNHWLFEHPRLMFIHFEAINKPLVFARHVREALDTLRKGPVT
ncbi:LppY/LpqO family protein [Alicyclobacillus dauci]|uniref:LppY/LpqO family protein n=1 Tax=Alicyclobacillus dauci TaxID=1475485 RepID=UPI00389908C6